MTEWHLDEETVARYARGHVSLSAGASVESHLLSCTRCQGLLAPTADTARLTRLWQGVRERVDAPRPGPVERLLRLVGVSDATARLLAATPALRGPWLLAMAATLAFAASATLATGGSERGTLLFLTVAPILPVAGVAAAFHRGVDPTYEIGLSTPYPQFRLLLLRSAAVTAVTCATALVAGMLLPARTLTTAAWLLPSLALAALTLVLARRFDAGYAAIAVGSGWTLTVVASHVRVEPFVVFGVLGQLLFLGVLAVSLVLLVAGRDRFAPRLGGW